jgi:hypothetical protein
MAALRVCVLLAMAAIAGVFTAEPTPQNKWAPPKEALALG